MADEETLVRIITNKRPDIERLVVESSHENPLSERHDRLQHDLDIAVDEFVSAYAQVQQTHPQPVHPAVLDAKKGIDRLCEHRPAEYVTLGKAYRKHGLLGDARTAMEQAAKNVDPAFWDDVAELERALGNEPRAGYIWRKMIEAWNGKREYAYALKFARKLGDASLIARYEQLAEQKG